MGEARGGACRRRPRRREVDVPPYGPALSADDELTALGERLGEQPGARSCRLPPGSLGRPSPAKRAAAARPDRSDLAHLPLLRHPASFLFRILRFRLGRLVIGLALPPDLLSPTSGTPKWLGA